MAPELVAKLQLTTAIRQGLKVKCGSEFQTTAQDILRLRLPEFTPIVPHGRDGDGGNDGYSKKLGVYAQIYAPEAARLPGREAARKAVSDFAKIRRHWHRLSPVKEYWFVTNAPGSNIHLERAFSDIEDRHGVRTRFVGAAELADHVAALPRARIEELMGFTVHDASSEERRSDGVNLLASVTAAELTGLHQLAAIAYPIPKELCERLLPRLTDWRALWPWLLKRGWVKEESNLIVIDDRVMAQCRKNTEEQRKACTRWITPLLRHGSSDCLYLAVLPLVMLGRRTEAIRVVSRAGWECEDAEWAAAILQMLESLVPLVRGLRASDKHALQLARANLLSRVGRHQDAVAAYERCLGPGRAWPSRINRGVAMLNCGVSAHFAGRDLLARSWYEQAIVWARRRRDDWVLGRAATNLVQLLDDPNRDGGELLIAEAEAAKRRFGDRVGLVGVFMARGLLAVHQSDPALAHEHFATACRMAKRYGAREALADVYFNLGKTSGEIGQWRAAAREYRRSLVEATRRADLHRESRARVGIAESLFLLGDLRGCGEASRVLAGLPDEPLWSSMRLTGIHGVIAVQLRTRGRASARDVARALDSAKKFGEQEWVGRILTDSVLGRWLPIRPRDLKGLLESGNLEAKVGRPEAAAYVYCAVWQFCAQAGGPFIDLGNRAASLLDRVLKDRRLAPLVAIEYSKRSYGMHLQAGQPWKALDVLRACAVRARRAKLWNEYARAVDQQAVTLAELGQIDASEPLHREALRCATRHQLREPMLISSSNLAECLRRRGRLTDAYRVSRTALGLHDLEQDPPAYVSALHNHYLIERDAGRASAGRTLRRCGRLAKRYGLRNETVRAIMAHGNAAWDRGDKRRATASFRRAVLLSDPNTDPTTIADARYNLALMLRQAGRADEALRILRDSDKALLTSEQQLQQASLCGLLLEETGSLSDASEAWREAATIADAVHNSEHRDRYMRRARCLAHAVDRQDGGRVIRRAESLLKAIYSTKASTLQARYDAAVSFYERSGLVQYHVHAHHAVAHRLAATGRTDHRAVAAQASIASLIVAFADTAHLQYAMELHIGWLMRLAISRPELKRLRRLAEKWVTDLVYPSTSKGVATLLLTGFDVVLDQGHRDRR